MKLKSLFNFTCIFMILWALTATKAAAQNAPEIGKSYYIAAQTWDGSKYVERLLYLSGNYVYQTTDISRASRWDALKPANGSGIALRTNSKYLMRGGISSASWGSLINPPELTISNPPEGSMTLFSTVTNFKYYIIAPNNGSGFNGTNAATEASYQPKTSLYTPYFKFYDTTTPIITVTETLVDDSETPIGASYLLTPAHGNPIGGNLWPVSDGVITVEKDSYNHTFYTFKGFKVGNSADLVQSVPTASFTANTTIKAVFETNDMQDEVFTFISSSSAWYSNQQVYKAIYLDPADRMLKWKTYDPADKAFYFKAHGPFDDLRFESVATPGQFITGATTATADTGNKVQLVPLGAGEYNIIANNQTFYAYNHGNGRNQQGTLTGAAGSSDSPASWWIQSANDQAAEQARYEAALEQEAFKVSEIQRENARLNLLNAIKSVVVGDQMGNVPLDAYELAVATYSNTTLSVEDYNNARTLLYSSCRVPAVGTNWRIINNANAGELLSVGINDGLIKTANRSSLYQMWQVAAINPEEPNQLAFRNLGSGTYMACNTMSPGSPTITTDNQTYVNLNAITPGIFSIEVLGRADQYIYFATGSNGPGIIVNTSGAWRFVEVPETELGQLSAAEDDRRAARQELLDLIDGATKLTTFDGGIGYYSGLSSAIATAKNVYADGTRLITEYQTGINNLTTAIRNAQYNRPEADALYIICDHDGRIAMQHEANQATLSTYDDTDLDHFWKLTAVPSTEDALLPWTQHYTLTSVEGENTVLNITATVIGNDEYLFTIEGDEAWNAENSQTPLSIHKASIGVHHGYLTDGEIYRIRNVATGKVLTRSPEWVALVTVENADMTATNWNQLWRVEMQTGADRYQLHNIESDRHIEEQLKSGQQLMAAFTPGTWHLQPTDVEGQYKLITTMAPITQLAIGYNADKAVAVSQDTQGTDWVFEKVTPVEKEIPLRQVCRFANRGGSTSSVYDYLYNNDRWIGHTRAKNAMQTEIYQRWALIERDSLMADGTPALDSTGKPIRLAAIQSAYNAKYLSAATTLSPYPYYYQVIEVNDGSATYLRFKNPRTNQYLAINTSKDATQWSTSNDTYTQWLLVPIEGELLTDEQIIDRSDVMRGFCSPEDGLVVRIYSYNDDTCLDEYYKQNLLQHKTENFTRYAQLWRLHQTSTGLYKIENIYTGNYIVNSTVASNAMTTTPDINKAGEFAISVNKNISATRRYNILDANLGLAMSAASTNITNAAPTNSDLVTPTEFRFRPGGYAIYGGYTEEDYAAMRRKYEENRDMLNNVAKYNYLLSTIFTDKSYSTLRDDVTEAEINDVVDNLPEMLADMVLKIYNDTWPLGRSGTNWEKMFRIREYPVVSNINFSGVIKTNFQFSSMNEPTGVLAHPGDVLAVMVKDAPKSGSTLCLEMIEGLNRQGTRITLNQGLNLIQVTEECNLFIYYMVNSTANDQAYFLSNFPDLKIHIEGGEVYGCINRVHGPGKTVQEADELWVKMQSDGLLKNSNMLQVVGESIILNFNSWDMLQGCPNKIGEVIDIWDFWIKIQQWIMGLRDHDGNLINDYIPNLKERFNSRWLAFERTGGYMNACTGGAQYNTSTIQSIINFNSLKNGGGAWGPVHEHGHDHQPLINMCGMTEVSNNLFSNVCVREFGAVVSRGTSLPDVANIYARGGDWYDNNIWSKTQMYYKLYLYYHVAGNKPTFYPEVFAKLRNRPMLHSGGTAIPANRDYLQFAMVCSEVAGEDLSEFFEAYGMMHPLTPENSLNGASSFKVVNGHNCRIVGDYSTYYVYTTDDMIAEAKAFMQSCGPRNGSIMFIDDRIRYEAAAHPWAQPGQVRANRGDGGRVGDYGNVGMWDDFTPEHKTVYARNYTLTKESTSRGIVLHVSGQGAVGYKIYGPQGELVYFSAFNDILLPAAILNKYDLADLVLVVAQADGTSVELACDDEKRYTMTTYRNGDPEGISMPVTGRFEPELLNNDVCLIEPIETVQSTEYVYAQTPNVIVKHGEGSYKIEHLNVLDKVNLYLPVDATCTAATYSRDNTEGWNSVCLPFAIDESDFDGHAFIYSVKDVKSEDGDIYLTLIRTKHADAGEPCYVQSFGDDGWFIDKAKVGTVTTNVALAISEDGNLQINGSFVNQVIGEGKYKLNDTGTAFGKTSATGRITAFRSYLEVPNVNAKTLSVRIHDDNTGIDEVVVDHTTLEQGDGIMYDLCGRRISEPVPGQPYIMQGRVYLSR